MMRSLEILVAIAMVATSTTAVADRPIGFDVQLGASVLERDALAIEMTTLTPVVAIAAVYRATDRISLGARVGGTRLRFAYEKYSSAGLYDYERHQIVPLDVSLIARYEARRAWVAPWLGWRFTRVASSEGTKYDGSVSGLRAMPIEWTSNSLSAGVAGGYQAWSWGRHHIGPFLDLSIGERARAQGESTRYAAVTLGLAFQR